MRIAPDGSKTEVVAEIAGAFPRESWDASKLVYNEPGGATGSGAVMVLPLQAGEPAGEAQEIPVAHRTLCAVAPGGLFYVNEDGLSFFDFERLESLHVFSLEEGMQVWSGTADGKTLIMLNRITNDSDLKLLREPRSGDHAADVTGTHTRDRRIASIQRGGRNDFSQ